MNKEVIIQFIKFGMVGTVNTILNYVIYLICIEMGLNYIMSNLIAFLITVFISYLLNGRFVFNKRVKGIEWIKALLKVYISYAGTSLLLNSVLLCLQIEVLSVHEKIAPLTALVITVPINFLTNKLWAYRSRRNEECK